MKYRLLSIFFFISLFAFAQTSTKRKKPKDVFLFLEVNVGVGMPIQHFASTKGDFFYHNASGFALNGKIFQYEAGLNFPKENCGISFKTIYGENQFDMNAYLNYLKAPPDGNFTQPGQTGITYSAVSSGFYKHLTFLFKLESEKSIKKFSLGFYAAAGTSRLLSFPDVKVAMDSASNHIVAGYSTKQHPFGTSLNYGITFSYHFNAHFFIKAVVDYLYIHYVFDVDYIHPKETGNTWRTQNEVVHYAYPVNLLNFSAGLGYRF